ncbi:MAG: SDR family oxidoreductase [Patescibacteria group bacterium]
MTKILITGSTGLIGSRIIELLKNDFEFIPFQGDITKKEDVETCVLSQSFDLTLHLAGYTNVDGAETEKDLAHKINVEGTKNLYETVKEKSNKFIYISSDFVFDGTTPPYDEESKPNPIGYYGQTKYDGEVVVKNGAMIVRIAYPYRAEFKDKKDFMRSIKSLLEQEKEIKGITDSTFTPTFIDDIVYGLKHLMNNYSEEIIHLVGSQTLTPYDAFKHIAKTFSLNESLIKKTTYAEYFTNKAKRPQYSEVKSKKNNFYKMKSFEEGLLLCNAWVKERN